MKYILNEIPIKTTNGFKVNNVKVDLDIPKTMKFHDYEFENIDVSNIETSIKKDFVSHIGLNNKEYKNTNILINTQINDLIKINYDFKEEDHLVDNININVDKGLDINICINYNSKDNYQHFHNGNININVEENSKLNITIINSININSINLISGNINGSNNSTVKINLIDLNGSIRIYNFKSNTQSNASTYLNNIYIGMRNDLIDMNYHFINEGINSNNNIEVQGVLDNNAIKTFKGTIDFKENSKKSIGHENENCLLLSDNCISKSVPILLCHEEEVIGSHSVSSGKIDPNKLFYLMCRGLDKEESKRLVIKSNFCSIINDIPEELRDIITEKIDEII